MPIMTITIVVNEGKSRKGKGTNEGECGRENRGGWGENVGNVEKGDVGNRCQGKQREKEIIILLILSKLVEHFQ